MVAPPLGGGAAKGKNLVLPPPWGKGQSLSWVGEKQKR